MKSVCLAIIAVVFSFLSLATTSASAMGFTNIFAHVHEKSDEEVSLLKQLMEDSHYTAKRLVIFPQRRSNINRHQSAAQQRRSQHRYTHSLKVTQSFASHDEEIIERLVELQN
mmetsp:Transcript_7314/g.17838  ORF Transcript_7314/g.17838 Transcript_7314/m.17838 type:complete len:113 (-) Transcript_7314:446-784(-)|eukprot:CAMPEP_0197173804 /NCGR_PEP_ID=MMETSP1423-20130617/593_1 /TAXON_ID=476441 /ORGANISM="Pseudo-nitzschia heimii, Strain UNC1101" /LENGTH=112 /DNA_ID=CAMNT_0042622667 /DNA_START=39 /DNA_END=377 /DNA_ORIENTATION=+